MAKVILHIGTHKTATTTIQDTFLANAGRLAEHGLIYPALGRVTGHHGLVYDWARLPPVYELPEGSRAAFRALAEKHADGEDTLFLSSEEFSRCGEGRVDLAEIRDLLAPFAEIEVVCTLRIQWQFLQSVYLELAKNRTPPRPPQLVKPVIDSGMFAGLCVDYNLLLDRLETVFAPEEITLFDYQSSRSAPGGILGTYLRHLGVALEADTLEKVNEGNSNVSPMPLASWASNILAEPKVATPWLINRATAMLREHFGETVETCLFTDGEIKMLREHFTPLNEALAERRRARQPGFALTEITPPPETVRRDGIDPSFWTRFCRGLVQERL